MEVVWGLITKEPKMPRSTLSPAPTARNAARLGREAATSEWTTTFARCGYAAKGVVYLIIGALAAEAAIGAGGATTSRTGALHAIYDQPFGKFLLAIVAVGLIGYAVWSIVRAIVDPEGEGTDAKGLASRVGFGVIAVSYAITAFAALKLVIGESGGSAGSGGSAQGWTGRLLQLPFGPALVVIIGVIVVGVALSLAYKAYSGKFQKRLDLSRLGATGTQWVTTLGWLGYAALGVVFTIIGIFLVVAALRHNPGETKGLGGALSELARQPYGHVALGIVAVG